MSRISMTLEERLKLYIREHVKLMKDLQHVRDLHLPDCFIGAGYIRSIIWDRLHGYIERENYSDIDVVYFCTESICEERDRALENDLKKKTGNNKWSVKNQARMHIKNGDQPYLCTEDAIAHWPETVTAVGARIDDNNEVKLIAPYGLQDLFEMTVRRSPLFQDREHYLQRIKSKNWLQLWPQLTILED